MMLRLALSRALLSAFAVSATPVLAAQPAVQVAAAEPEPGSNKTELKAFEQVKVSVANAIAAANKHTGGKVTEASFAMRNGKPIYKVKTYQDSNAWEGTVDAQTGQVIGNGKSTPESKLDAEDKAELAGLQIAKVTLAQAVSAAEARNGGKAMAAGIEQAKGKVVFEVSVVKDGSVRK